jgi:hypothetical protein
MVQWDIFRHQVAIAGQVTDTQTKKAIGKALVSITVAPTAFVTSVVTKAKLVVLPNEPTNVVNARAMLDNIAVNQVQKLEAAQKILDFLQARQALKIVRTDKTRTAVDGWFSFWNLPNGQYTLTASLPGSGTRYSVTSVENVSVSRNDEGDINMAVTDITLQPTSLIGLIQQGSGDLAEPITLAEVRIKGSQDSALSNSKGQYALIGVEASMLERIILVSAQGYKPQEGIVTLSKPGEQKTLNFELTALTGNS